MIKHILDAFYHVRQILHIFSPLRIKFVASTILHRFHFKITFETNCDASK
jgi:hypothetical protein